MTPIKHSPLILMILGHTLAGCGDESAPRVRIDLGIDARGSNAVHETQGGWTVTVDAARLHIETIRFFEGEPLFARRWPRFELIGRAQAHPGHYVPGEALADIVTPVDLDLLAETPISLEGNGVTGHFGSAEVALQPAGSSGVTAEASGRAAKGERIILFSVSTDLAVEVRGVPVESDVSESVRFDMLVDLERWLGRIDFDTLPAATTTITFSAGSQAHNAFLRGVNNTSAFDISKQDNP